MVILLLSGFEILNLTNLVFNVNTLNQYKYLNSYNPVAEGAACKKPAKHVSSS